MKKDCSKMDVFFSEWKRMCEDSSSCIGCEHIKNCFSI